MRINGYTTLEQRSFGNLYELYIRSSVFSAFFFYSLFYFFFFYRRSAECDSIRFEAGCFLFSFFFVFIFGSFLAFFNFNFIDWPGSHRCANSLPHPQGKIIIKKKAEPKNAVHINIHHLLGNRFWFAFTRFVFTAFFRAITELQSLLPSFTQFERAFKVINGFFYRESKVITGFYWVSKAITGFYWVLPSFTRFSRS